MARPAAADAPARRGDDLEFVISIDCRHSTDITVYYSVTNGNYLTAAWSTTINSGDTTTTVRVPTTGGAHDIGLYLAWVTGGVDNPSGVWARSTIND